MLSTQTPSRTKTSGATYDALTVENLALLDNVVFEKKGGPSRDQHPQMSRDMIAIGAQFAGQLQYQSMGTDFSDIEDELDRITARAASRDGQGVEHLTRDWIGASKATAIPFETWQRSLDDLPVGWRIG